MNIINYFREQLRESLSPPPEVRLRMEKTNRSFDILLNSIDRMNRDRVTSLTIPDLHNSNISNDDCMKDFYIYCCNNSIAIYSMFDLFKFDFNTSTLTTENYYLHECFIFRLKGEYFKLQDAGEFLNVFKINLEDIDFNFVVKLPDSVDYPNILIRLDDEHMRVLDPIRSYLWLIIDKYSDLDPYEIFKDDKTISLSDPIPLIYNKSDYLNDDLIAQLDINSEFLNFDDDDKYQKFNLSIIDDNNFDCILVSKEDQSYVFWINIYSFEDNLYINLWISNVTLDVEYLMIKRDPINFMSRIIGPEIIGVVEDGQVQSDSDSNTESSNSTIPSSIDTTIKKPLGKETQLEELVNKLVQIVGELGIKESKDLISRAEAIMLAGMGINSDEFWKKSIFGVASLYSLYVNESVLVKTGTLVSEFFFNTSDLTEISLYTKGLKENIFQHKIPELISYMLIPFNVDIDIGIERLRFLQIKCAEEVKGLNLIESIMEGSLFIKRGVQEFKETGNILGFCMSEINMEKKIKEYTRIASEYSEEKNNPGMNVNYEAKVKEVGEFLLDVEQSMKRSKNPTILRWLSNVHIHLGGIYGSYVAKTNVGKLVKRPLSVLIAGKSQIGKSTVSSYIMKHLQELDGEVTQTEGEKVYPPIVTVRGDEKFIEQADNDSKYLYINDIANVKPEFCSKSPVDLMLRACNVVKTPLDQAAVERKGKIAPEWNAIISDTNIPTLNAKEYSVLSSSIMLRADVVIEVNVRREYQNKGGTLNGGLLAHEYSERVSEIEDAWEITVYKVVTSDTTLIFKGDFQEAEEHVDVPWKFEKVTYKGVLLDKVSLLFFFDYLAHKHQDHFKIQKAFIEGMRKKDMESVFCYDCRREKTNCQCSCSFDGVTESGYMHCVSSLISGSIDKGLRRMKTDLDASVLGVFGIHLTKRQFFERLELLFSFVLSILEESRLFHHLTLLPDNVYNNIDKFGVVLSSETNKVSKIAAKEIYKFSLTSLFGYILGLSFGLIGVFMVFWARIMCPEMWVYTHKYSSIIQKPNKVIPLFFISSILILVYSWVFYKTYEETERFDFMVSGMFNVVNTTLFYKASKFSKFKNLFKRNHLTGVFTVVVKNYNYLLKITKNFFHDKYEFSDFKYIAVAAVVLTILYGEYYTTQYIIDRSIYKYVENTIYKIDKARSIITQNYKKLFAYNKKVVPQINLQSGKHEFYVKEWELLNRQKFDVIASPSDEVLNSIKHNQVVLVDDNGDGAQGLVVRTGKLLLPAHFIKDKPFYATLLESDNPKVGSRKVIVEVTKDEVIPITNKDAVILNFSEGRSYKDITKWFSNKTSLPLSGFRLHRDKNGVQIIDKVTSFCKMILPLRSYCATRKKNLLGIFGFSYVGDHRSGYSGSPLVESGKRAMILGIHVGGNVKDNMDSYGIQITKDELMEAVLKESSINLNRLELAPLSVNPFGIKDEQPLTKHSALVYMEDDRNINYLGNFGGHVTIKNEVFHHSIKDNLVELGYKCSYVSPIKSSKSPRNSIDNFLKVAGEQGYPLPTRLVKHAVNDYFRPFLNDYDLKDVKVWKRKQVIYGVSSTPLVGGIDWSTSAGWPFSGAKSDLDFVEIKDNGQIIVKEEFWDKIKSVEESLSNGIRVNIPAIASLKMEPRKEGKDLRVFQCMSLVITFLIRKYFGGLIKTFLDDSSLSECVVGINPYGFDFDEMVKAMSIKLFNNWSDGDFKTFDLRIKSVAHSAIFVKWINICKKAGYSDYDLRVANGVLALLLTPTVSVDGACVEMMGMMPSGCVATTLIDSQLVSIYKRVAFYNFYDANTDFRSFVKLRTFGDDSIQNNTTCLKYNSQSEAELLGKFGIIITPADKTSKHKLFKNVTECSFLKRTIRYCNARGRMVGALEIDSIFKPLMTYKLSKALSPDEILSVNLDRAKIELSYHPEDVFNYHSNNIDNIDSDVVRKSKYYNCSYDYMVKISDSKLEEELPRLKDKPGDVEGIQFIHHRERPFLNPLETVDQDPIGVTESGKMEEIKDMPETEVQENMELHGGQTQEVSYSENLIPRAVRETNLSISSFVERPILLMSYESTPTALFEGISVDPLVTLLTNPRISNRLSNYTGIAADIEITILVTATPYYFGQFICAYWPNFKDNLTVVPSGQKGNVILAQHPHVMFDIAEDETCKMVIPFFWYYEYFDYANAVQSYGTLFLRGLTPLRAVGDVPTQPLSIRVFGRLTNVRLKGLTVNNSVYIATQAGELDDQGPVSKVASAVHGIAGTLANFPILAPYARASEIAAGATYNIARLFGYSRPPVITERNNVVNKPMGYLANANVEDDVDRLTVDIRQELTVSPSSGGIDMEDPLSIAYIAQKTSYLYSFTWLASNLYGDAIGSIRVDPNFHLTYGTSNYKIVPPLAAVSLPFRYYTGTLIYTFRVVCNRFHRGRLLIRYDPLGNGLATELPMEYNTLLTYEVDISTNKEIEIEVPVCRTFSYIPTRGIIGGSLNDYYIAPGTTQMGLSTSSNGVLFINVLNKLSVPLSAGVADVQILAFVRAGKDFRLAKPRDSVLRHLRPVAVTESGALDKESYELSDTTGQSDKLDLDYMGESIKSLRQLCKRYNYYKFYLCKTIANPIGSSTYRFRAYPLIRYRFTGNANILFYTNELEDNVGGDVPYNFNYLTMYQYCALMFHGVRGNIRYKVKTQGYTNNNSLIVGSWTDTPIGSYPTSMITTADASPLTGGAILMKTYNDAIPYSADGVAIASADVNDILSMEIPYQSNQLFGASRSLDNEERSFNIVEVTVISKEDNTNADHGLHMFSAAGEDFQVFFFRGLPLVVYDDDFPSPSF